MTLFISPAALHKAGASRRDSGALPRSVMSAHAATEPRTALSDWLHHNAGIRGYQPNPADSIDFEETVEAVVLEGP